MDSPEPAQRRRTTTVFACSVVVANNCLDVGNALYSMLRTLSATHWI